MSVRFDAARAARLAAKYGPHVAVAVKVAGPTVKKSVEVQRRRLANRHAAFDKARTVIDGSVLRQRDGNEVVFVVFSGEQPVAVYPDAATPVAELVRTADLSKRVTREEFEAAKVSARAVRAARRVAHRGKTPLGSAADPTCADSSALPVARRRTLKKPPTG